MNPTSSSALARRPWLAQAALDTPLGPARVAATALGLGGFWFDDQAHHPGLLQAPQDPEQRWLAQARDELARYWSDAPRAHFSVPLDLGGTPFQQAVWAALLHPVSILVPCHRVLGSDGSLTGYAGGLHRKTDLLRREQAALTDRNGLA
jgi:methylated-DNA-[protein]-cysteine S-methyltransferase